MVEWKKCFGSLEHFISPHGLQHGFPKWRRQSWNAIIKDAVKMEMVLASAAFTQDSTGLPLSTVATLSMPAALLTLIICSENMWDVFLNAQLLTRLLGAALEADMGHRIIEFFPRTTQF